MEHASGSLPEQQTEPAPDNNTIPTPIIVSGLECDWEDCMARVNTVQKLVQHIYSAHVAPQSARGRWACRWKACSQAKKAWHRSIGSERMLLAHLREESARSTDWSCALCDACQEFRVGDVAKHIELFHGVLAPAHDRGSKSAKRKNGTHVPPPSGAKPRPPRFNTETGQLFTGYTEPLNMEAIRPREYPISPTLRDRIVNEARVHPQPATNAITQAETVQQSLGVDAQPLPSASMPEARLSGHEDQELVQQPVASTSGTHAEDAIANLEDNVTGAPAVDALGPIRAARAASPTVNVSPSSSLALRLAPMEARSPAPVPAPAPRPQKDYRAAYLIEKAKYRYATEQRDALQRELAQLRAEYEAAYGEKEVALDNVLRAQFGSTADSVLSTPSS
ncbi:hypothetical protein AURDEDRAFT_149897 [Auricularia subglabra TFB-10046 SS5]|nr:hypothetical protein AURDEDRAFT_149897 [Auricularia subglabra TFB-10046 SS5]